MHLRDNEALCALLAEHPLPKNADNNLDLTLRHLTEVLRTNVAWQRVIPSLPPALRQQLVATCHVLIKEHGEVVDVIYQGYDSGYCGIGPDEAAIQPRQIIAGLRKLAHSLARSETEEK